jgi:hypothetical protein
MERKNCRCIWCQGHKAVTVRESLDAAWERAKADPFSVFCLDESETAQRAAKKAGRDRSGAGFVGDYPVDYGDKPSKAEISSVDGAISELYNLQLVATEALGELEKRLDAVLEPKSTKECGGGGGGLAAKSLLHGDLIARCSLMRSIISRVNSINARLTV